MTRTVVRLRSRLTVRTAMLLVVLLLATIARLLLALHSCIWTFWPDSADDGLMLHYSHLSAHFADHGTYALAKDMSYPLLLAAVHGSGVPYTAALFGLWMMAALHASAAARSAGLRNPWALTGVYAYVLFSPSAFDGWTGTQLYRNAIIAPVTYIVLSSLVMLAFGARRGARIRQQAMLASWAGAWLTYDFYITEAPAWLIPVVAVISAYVLLRHTVLSGKNLMAAAFGIIPAVLPFSILALGSVAYSSVNEHYFGVYATNTRTVGPFADVMAIAYRIDDTDQWESGVWVTADTWRRMWAESPTLRSAPHLLADLLASRTARGHWDTTPPMGDLSAWAFRYALANSGFYATEARADQFMTQVRTELRQAIAAGRLPQSHKLSIGAGAPTRSMDEVTSLTPLVFSSVAANLFDAYWSPAHHPCPDEACVAEVQDVAHVPATSDNAGRSRRENAPTAPRTSTERVEQVLVDIHRWLSYGVALGASAGLLIGLMRLRRWRTTARGGDALRIGLALVLACTGVALNIGVAWFISWLFIGQPGRVHQVMGFYAVGSTPCFVLAELLLLITLARSWSRAIPTVADQA